MKTLTRLQPSGVKARGSVLVLSPVARNAMVNVLWVCNASMQPPGRPCAEPLYALLRAFGALACWFVSCRRPVCTPSCCEPSCHSPKASPLLVVTGCDANIAAAVVLYIVTPLTILTLCCLQHTGPTFPRMYARPLTQGCITNLVLINQPPLTLQLRRKT